MQCIAPDAVNHFQRYKINEVVATLRSSARVAKIVLSVLPYGDITANAGDQYRIADPSRLLKLLLRPNNSMSLRCV